jgi:uncharacterized membrane protein YfcA
MMKLELSMFLIVCPMVFLAGLVDSIAGGGGLISLPAYIFAGVPIHFALGTNKLSSVMGAVVSAVRYYRGRCVDLALCLPSVAASLAGSALGTSLTLIVDERYLQRLLLGVLPLTAFYIFRRKDYRPPPFPIPRSRQIPLSILISFVIGGYDGFFGPGTGTFLILLYMGLIKLEPRIASGNANFVNLGSNISSALLFILHGRLIIPLGLCAGLFNIAGAYIGSGLAIRRGGKIIRIFIIAVLILLFLKIIWDMIQGSL